MGYLLFFIAIPFLVGAPIIAAVYFIFKLFLKKNGDIEDYISDHYLKTIRLSTILLFIVMLSYLLFRFYSRRLYDFEWPALLMFLIFCIQSGFYFLPNKSAMFAIELVFWINIFLAIICFWVWAYFIFQMAPI